MFSDWSLISQDVLWRLKVSNTWQELNSWPRVIHLNIQNTQVIKQAIIISFGSKPGKNNDAVLDTIEVKPRAYVA